MNKSKLGYFFDNVALYFLSFTICFVLLKTIIINNVLIIILSLILSFIILKIILFFQNKNLRQLSIKKTEKQDILNCNFALRKMSEASQITFFKNMLNEKDLKKTPHGLVVNNQILLYIALNIDIIKTEHIFTIYSKVKNMRGSKIQEICLICNKASEDIKSIIDNFDIKFTIFAPEETYSMMKQFSYFPPLPEKPAKIKKNIFKESFMKQKGKSFIKCALAIYIFSLFMPITKYYLISASILLLIGIICLCFGKQNKKIEPLSKQILLKRPLTSD